MTWKLMIDRLPHRWAWLAVGVLSLLAVFPPQAAPAERASSGGLEFFLDTAVFAKPGGLPMQEIYLRLSNSELRFKKSDGRHRARVRVWMGIKDEEDEVIVNDRREFDFYEDDEQRVGSPLHFQTLITKYRLRPGRYELTCRLDDLNSPKVTVFGMVKKNYKSGAVGGMPLEVPEYPRHTISLSDAKFIWDAGGAGPEAVQHPNPSRMYGLYMDTLHVYLELYVPDTLAVAEDLQFKSAIIDEKGEVVKEALLALPPLESAERPRHPEGPRIVTYPIMINEDLTVVPAGNYTLYINVGRGGQLISRVRRGNFSVAWDLRTWELSRKTYLAEARFLLADEDFSEFTGKSPGDQEKALQKMWKELDPDPTTGVNEAYEEFLRRLEHVNRHFSDYQLGIFTDRGLIYLRYGPPDEVVQDVVPQNRETMSDALEKVKDKYHEINYSSRGSRMGYSVPARDILIDPRRVGVVGEGGNVAYPYELWVYNGKGAPILERDRNLEPDIGIRFIFVDREGYGRYRLESSSSITNK